MRQSYNSRICIVNPKGKIMVKGFEGSQMRKLTALEVAEKYCNDNYSNDHSVQVFDILY